MRSASEPGWIPLVGARVALRAPCAADAQALFEIRSDAAVARYQSWTDFTICDAEAMIDQMRGRSFRASGRWYQLVIATSGGDLPIGDLAFRFPAGVPDQAEVGFNIARRHWRKGYGREAILRMADWLRSECAVRRVFAVTDERNHACRKLLGRCGFAPAPKGWRLVFFKGEWAGEMVYELVL